MDIVTGLSRLCLALAILSGFAAFVIWNINKWGDQGGIGEKTMMSAVGAAVAFGIASAFISANAGIFSS